MTLIDLQGHFSYFCNMKISIAYFIWSLTESQGDL